MSLSVNEYQHRTKKSVTFYKRVRVKKTLHHNDLTSREIRSYWYSQDDTKDMKKDIKITLEILDLGWSLTSNDQFCLQGIEPHTRQGCLNRMKNKRISRKAVLLEQEAQRAEGIRDPEAIAAAYRAVSLSCANKARKSAFDDLKEPDETSFAPSCSGSKLSRNWDTFCSNSKLRRDMS